MKTPNSEPAQAPGPLDHLDAVAAQVDADTTGQLPNGELIADQPLITNHQAEAKATVETLGALMAGYCPPAGEMWNSRADAMAAALTPVFEKYGWSLGAIPCELTALIVIGPVAYQCSKLIAYQIEQERAARKPAAKPAQAQATPQTAAPEELGPARHPQEALYP